MKTIDLFHLDTDVAFDEVEASVFALLEALTPEQRYLLWVNPFSVQRDETSPIPLYIVARNQAARYYAIMELVGEGGVFAPSSHQLVKCKVPRPAKVAA